MKHVRASKCAPSCRSWKCQWAVTHHKLKPVWFDGSDYFGVGVDGELYERSNFATLMNDDLLATAVDGCG